MEIYPMDCGSTENKTTGIPSSISLPRNSKSFTLKLHLSVDLSKTGDDLKDPCIIGLDFLPGGRLVAVDNWNNKCIILNELLQRQGTPYTLSSSPLDVVVLSRNEIALTMSNYNICFLSVSSDNVIRLTRQIPTSSGFISICCKTPTNLVVSTFNDPRAVRMISVDGVVTDFDHVEFPKKTYNAHESKCTYVQSKNMLVLTDKHANTVYMYDTVKGTCKAVTGENIQEPQGACVGPGDTVLVCSAMQNSIMVLDVDGDILGTYPVDMRYPWNLCVSKDGTLLAVCNPVNSAIKLQLYKIVPAHTNQTVITDNV